MSPEERALFIVKVLDTAQSNVFPSEAEIETLSPYVDQIRSDYEERRGRGFHSAYQQSRAKFITTALREAGNAKLEEAALVCERRALANHDGVGPNGTCLNDAFAIRSLKSKEPPDA